MPTNGRLNNLGALIATISKVSCAKNLLDSEHTIYLEIQETPITVAGLRDLKELPLVYLRLSSTISNADAKQLRQLFPKTRIEVIPSKATDEVKYIFAPLK